MEVEMSSSYDKLKEIVNRIVSEQINTLMFHLSTEPVEKQKVVLTMVLEEILKMVHGTRWHSITLVQLGNLFEMLQEDEQTHLNDFIFNGTNRFIFELEMVGKELLSMNVEELAGTLSSSITSTRKPLAGGNKLQSLVSSDYRERGMNKDQWLTVMRNDPWVMFIVLLCYLNVDIQEMLPPPRKPKVKPNA